MSTPTEEMTSARSYHELAAARFQSRVNLAAGNNFEGSLGFCHRLMGIAEVKTGDSSA